ncbi:MAG TPA: SDR family NAD(P)-dependent oxidoreductase, partial [Nitrospira sp.]
MGCARRGMTVFAGVRNLKAGEALQRDGGPSIIPLQLDVTEADSIRHAAEVVCTAVGSAGLSGLVNNAGIAIGSPLEVIPIPALRK